MFRNSDGWTALESELGRAFPEDYKAILDAYAPVQLNHHLYLDHPANEFRPLGSWISRVVRSFGAISWDPGMACPGFENVGPQFGGRLGMIPIASTDRGEYAFLGPYGDRNIILTWGRDAPDFYAHDMTFGEWLKRYLAGEEMFMPGVAARYPGPIILESLPTRINDPVITWHGPDQNT
ncbi:SMI1/KNR4 family protein [Streptomyces sp. NPDC003943]